MEYVLNFELNKLLSDGVELNQISFS